MIEQLRHYLKPDAVIVENEDYLESPLQNITPAIEANAIYFNNTDWAEEYLTFCHPSDPFTSRWKAAIGDWSNKVVVDIGCGPGNIFASLQGHPEIIIGVDVAKTSLSMAKKIGYLPLLADANELPFISGFADVVVLNAALHHCEDMEAVLKEAARLVKPGGVLITDHDPQLSAWKYNGLAKLMWNSRLLLYKILRRGFHKTDQQQYWGLKCEIHHKPGHEVTHSLFRGTLEKRGFTVNIYPHNHQIGADVLLGEKGKAELKYVLANLLSGRNPRSDESALTLMCIAKKDL